MAGSGVLAPLEVLHGVDSVTSGSWTGSRVASTTSDSTAGSGVFLVAECFTFWFNFGPFLGICFGPNPAKESETSLEMDEILLLFFTVVPGFSGSLHTSIDESELSRISFDESGSLLFRVLSICGRSKYWYSDLEMP